MRPDIYILKFWTLSVNSIKQWNDNMYAMLDAESYLQKFIEKLINDAWTWPIWGKNYEPTGSTTLTRHTFIYLIYFRRHMKKC